jgi:hypothetical protein
MLENKTYSEFPHLSHEHMQVLLQCFSVCSSCAKMCMQERMADTAILCSECADICALTIKWHSADSAFSSKISALCADVCFHCAEACAKNDSHHCQQCSEVCYECAKACQA